MRSDTRYLALLRQIIPAAFSVAGMKALPPKVLGACTLALIEAVDNAIFHAHRRSRRMPVGVSVSISGSRIALSVSDCGGGIGRRGKMRPDCMVTHGRGLFLIHKLMAGVKSSVRNGRHSLRMVHPI